MQSIMQMTESLFQNSTAMWLTIYTGDTKIDVNHSIQNECIRENMIPHTI